MRTFRLLPLLMLFTFTFVTTGAATLAETVCNVQPGPKHLKNPKPKKPRHKEKRPAPKPRKRPAGVVVNYNRVPYIYSQGRYYRDRGGTYVLVKPLIGMIVPSLPSGYVKVKRPYGKIGYAFGGVIYEKIASHGGFKFKIVGFM